MDAFARIPPDWTEKAIHATAFCCPTCRALSTEAEGVWINYRSPVFTENLGRKRQEFYHCHCGSAWWAWNTDRPPTQLKKPDPIEPTLPEDWIF